MKELEIVQPISKFENFLFFIDKLEEYSCRDDTDTVKDFLDLLKDPFRTSVSGSSLLAHRLGKTFGKDIDIFIEDTGDLFGTSALDIVKTFFQENAFNLEQFCMKTPSRSDNTISRSTTNWVSTDYPFESGKFLLESRNYDLPDKTRLNFIFVRSKVVNEIILRKSHNTENFLRVLCGFIGVTIPTQLLGEYDLGKIFRESHFRGLGSVLQYIIQNFDMTELKYAWCFESQKAKLIYKVQSDMREICKNIFLAHEDDQNYWISDTTSDSSRAQRAIQYLNNSFLSTERYTESLINVIEKQQKDNILTIASKLTQAYKIVNEYNLLMYSEVEINSFRVSDYIKLLINLNHRIKKYTEYGFEVQDPTNVVLNLSSNLIILQAKLLSSETVKKIIKRDIIMKSKEDLLATKYTLKNIEAQETLLNEEISKLK